jgi:hypothetical protein
LTDLETILIGFLYFAPHRGAPERVPGFRDIVCGMARADLRRPLSAAVNARRWSPYNEQGWLFASS